MLILDSVDSFTWLSQPTTGCSGLLINYYLLLLFIKIALLHTLGSNIYYYLWLFYKLYIFFVNFINNYFYMSNT